jgi:hypothetical protein
MHHCAKSNVRIVAKELKLVEKMENKKGGEIEMDVLPT